MGDNVFFGCPFKHTLPEAWRRPEELVTQPAAGTQLAQTAEHESLEGVACD